MIYQFLGLMLFPFLLLYFSLKKPVNIIEEIKSIKERLGIGVKLSSAIAYVPSIGEANVFLTFYEKFTAKMRVEFTALTSTITAKNLLNRKITSYLAPLDNILFYIPLIFYRVNYVFFIEGDIWITPLVIFKLKAARIFLINARVSKNTFKKMKKLKFIYKWIFSRFDLICAREESDYRILKEFTNKVTHTGNIKYDFNFTPKNRDDYGIKNDFVVVFGSFHIEEIDVLKITIAALRNQIPDLKIIVVPRRIEHTEKFVKELNGNLYSRDAIKDITIVDIYGKLPEFYSLCDVAVIGGSFFPHGGQNPLEATFFGKPVLFGKYMDNFREVADTIINEKAGFMVKGIETLTQKILELYSNEPLRFKVAENAMNVNKKYSGATNRCIYEVIKYI